MASIELRTSEPLLTNGQISALANPVKPTSDTPLIRSMAIARTAEALDVSLDLTDIAIATGEEIAGRFDGAFQTVKAGVPFLQSRNKKLEKVWAAEIDNIWDELEEQKTGLELSNWMSTLTPTELEHVEVADCDYGDPFLSPLRLTVKGTHTAAESFELGDHFNYAWKDDNGPYATLPSAVRERLASKQAFWEGLISNGAELRDFKEKYFTKIKVDFDKEELPPEVSWLEAKDTAESEQHRIFARLRALHEVQGHDIYLWVLKKVPPSVIRDTLKIAGTQEKFITTWLSGFVKREKMPVIVDADVQAVQIARETARTKYGNDTSAQSDFRSRYLLAEVDQQLTDDLDFEQSLRNIEHLRSLVLGIELAGGTEDVETQNVINRANALLDMDLSGEKVTDRIMIDTVLHTTENAKHILRIIPLLVGVAEGLQHIPVSFIRSFSKAVGASDDLVGEASEVSNLRAQGYKWSEFRSRLGFVGGTAIGAVALGTQVVSIEAIDPRLAAVAYACTTFATTAATLVATMRTSSQGYKSLAAQGKLQEMPYLNSEERALLQRAIIDAPTSEVAVERVEQHLSALFADQKGIDQKEMRKRIDGIKGAAYRRDSKQAMGYVAPSSWEALRAAYAEVFKANPVREGKLASIPLMLGGAAILGKILLSTPLLYVPFGMAESLGGLAGARFANKHENAVWQKKVARLTTELKLAPQNGS